VQTLSDVVAAAVLVEAGDNHIRVAMGEGEQCAVGHRPPVKIKKRGK